MAEGWIQLDPAMRADFGKRPLKSRHTLHASDLFTDHALTALLDRFPRSYLYALTMGEDPERPDENRLASHDGVSGADLLAAVKHGRLWLNITRVTRFEPAYRELVDELFAQLKEEIPGFVCDGSQATLLLSSPSAQVYYHADSSPSALWHIRGKKRLWLYPAMDERFLSREHLEDIVANARHEYVPYRKQLDAHATVYDLEPGDWAAWAQNAPHRVVNLDGLNVSLSTEYFTPESRARIRTFTANRFLRQLGARKLSDRVTGPMALAKVAAQRAARAAGLEKMPPKIHVATCRVDPSAPLGIAPLKNEVVRGPLTVKRFESFAELASLREQLAALNARSRMADPYSTLEFCETFVAHDEFEDEQSGRELWFLAAFEGEQLTGYLALQRRTMKALGIAAKVLEVLVTRDCDRPHLVARPDDEQRCAHAFLQYLAEHEQEWSYLELKQQDPRSPFWILPERGAPAGYYVREFPSMENGTVPIRWRSFKDYHQACSKKHRGNMSRAARAILGAGEVLYLSSDDPAVTPALLDLYATLEPRSWKSHAGGTIGRHEKRMRFFRALLSPEQPMRISIDVLLIDGVPVAGLINGHFGDRLYAMQICYDASREDLGSGALMLMMGVRRAILAGHREYNLLSGFGYYKKRFLAELTQTRSVQLFRKGSPFYWKAKLGELKRALQPEDHGGDYNRVKRQVEQTVALPQAPVELSAQERARIAELVAQVRQGRHEALDNTGFAAAMPFDTRELRKTASARRSDSGSASPEQRA